MMLLQTLAAFLVVLGVLVVVHELGHYLVARWCGVKVLRFSVGMGKVIYSRRFGADQTEWALSAVPLGGYVKMLDARETDLTGLPESDLNREFTRQSVWKRIAIVAAGPLANFLLAIVVFAGLYSIGIPEPAPRLRTVPQQTAAYEAGLRGGELITAVDGKAIKLWSDLRWKVMQAALERKPARLDVERVNPNRPDERLLETLTLATESLAPTDLEGDFLGRLGIDLARPKATLGKIFPGGPAQIAGLQTGDTILMMDGRAIEDGLALVETIRASAGRTLTLSGMRADQRPFSLKIVPEIVQRDGQTIGRIQAEVPMMPEMVTASSPPLEALSKGVERTWDTSALTVKMLGKMLIGEVSMKNITGPITIADYAGQTARIGIVSFLSFIALISISLGVMNLLPIPVLDGGHLLYYALEVLTGRPVSERVGAVAQRAGLGILMTLMIVAVFNDIVRLMT